MNRRGLITAMLAATAATTITLAGCSSTAGAAKPVTPILNVSEGYVRQPMMKDMAAGYFTVSNSGTANDQLTSVTSDLAAEVTMHRTAAGGVMQPVKSFTIPAGGRLVLAEGGNHLMLMNLRKLPAVGDTVTFELHFAKSAPITVKVPVKPTSYTPKG